MPCDAVPAIAVEAHPDRAKRLSELVAVLAIERGAHFVERRMRQRRVLVVEVLEPRDVHDALVHLATLRPPGHLCDQMLIELLRPSHPTGPQLDPCSPLQREPFAADVEGAQHDLFAR